MTRRLPIALLLLATVLSAGCFSFRKSSTKSDTNLTAEVEGDFKTRWMDKRVAELVAQGQNAEAARAQATAEFKERYGYTGAAQK